MNRVCLLLSAVLLLQIPKGSAECRVVQILRGVAQYTCDSMREVEEQGNSEMQELSVHGDKSLPAISTSTFQKTPNVNRLVIKNSISDINPGALRPLRELLHLDINNNELREMKVGMFENSLLDYLDLSHNSVIYIEPGAFSKLTHLKKLYLRNNRLGRIQKGIFSDLPVETLGLSKNRIALLEKNAFENMPNLKRLHLDGNLLSEFQAEQLLNYGHKLEILWLHNNSFREISRKTVKGLDNLRLLNLQDNRISRILPYTFEKVLNLEVLVLSNNSLYNLDADVFSETGMPTLTMLYLNDNRFSYLTTRTLERLANLKAIRIGGNPWQCPCLDIISMWVSDHGVKQNCDKDYYSGTRPICVVVDTHPTNCVYEDDQASYQSYNDINSKFPKNTPCTLRFDV